MLAGALPRAAPKKHNDPISRQQGRSLRREIGSFLFAKNSRSG